jgi:hypothetical protein
MLAETFQTSRHAAIRRYAEDAARPCALLVLGRFLNRPGGRNSVVVRQGIESETFRQKYGRAAECLPSYLPLDENELAEDAYAAVRGTGEPITTGQIMVSTPKRGTTRMDYEIFYNQYQVFALLMPTKLRIFRQRLSAEWTT